MWDLETIKMLNNRRHESWQELQEQRKKLKSVLKVLDAKMYAKLKDKKGVFSD